MENIHDILIPPEATLKAAMEQMTRSRKGILLVVNPGNRLLGVLSDGDVRRSLLQDALMGSPISQIMNTDPIVAHDKAEGNRLLDQKSLALVPVINKDRLLVSIVYEESGQKRSLDLVAEGKTGQGDILIIIPARGGSKRIPQKNLQKIGGYSLVARAVRTARSAFDSANIIVSTDDTAIAKEAERNGARVPWLRPAELSTDATGTFAVIEHALQKAMEGGANYAAVLLLEPTAPLRQPFHLIEAVRLLQSGDADSVVSVSELPHVFHPDELITVTNSGTLTPYIESAQMHTRRLRGQQKKVFVQNGIVYAFRPDTVIKKKNLYGDKSLPLPVDWKYFADIDEPVDLVSAEAKLKTLY